MCAKILGGDRGKIPTIAAYTRHDRHALDLVRRTLVYHTIISTALLCLRHISSTLELCIRNSCILATSLSNTCTA